MVSPVRRKLLQAGAIPGANLGATFTSSIQETLFSPDGAYLDRFEMSAKADTATAAVTMTTFLNLVQPFQFKVNGVPRIQARGSDLWAMNAAFLNRTPGGYVADDTNDDAKIRGIHVPVWETVRPNTSYSYAVSRVAQTNVSGEVLTLASRSTATPLRRPLYYVEITGNSAAATGLSTFFDELPRLGDLLGMQVFLTTVPTNTADASTFQHFQLRVADVIEISSGVDDISIDDDVPINNEVATDWGATVIDNYRFFDFRDAPIDLIANKVSVLADTQATSEAARLLPIIQLRA